MNNDNIVVLSFERISRYDDVSFHIQESRRDVTECYMINGALIVLQLIDYLKELEISNPNQIASILTFPTLYLVIQQVLLLHNRKSSLLS